MNIFHNHATIITLLHYRNIMSNNIVFSFLYYSSFDSYYNSDNYNNTSYIIFFLVNLYGYTCSIIISIIIYILIIICYTTYC